MTQSNPYFSPDYSAARSRFRQMVAERSGRLVILELDARGPGNEILSIDIGWFGTEMPRRVLLHSSGLHGVEGFAGSAIQLQLLEILPFLPADFALILVHILNPYGMAWLRRVNEENVDLNRNFLGPGEKFEGAPDVYIKLNSLLNPESPPSMDLFLLRAAWLLFRHGTPVLRQAVAQGQYEYRKGLFFGGKRLQQGPERYQSFLASHLSLAEQVIAIDVHTALGKFGKDVLLVEPKHWVILRRVFGERVRPLEANDSPAFRLRGGYFSMLSRAFPQAEVFLLGQEFGTYSGLKVLHSLREENRLHHFGDRTLDHQTKRNLKESFCPKDPAWQSAVLARGKALVEETIGAFQKLSITTKIM